MISDASTVTHLAQRTFFDRIKFMKFYSVVFALVFTFLNLSLAHGQALTETQELLNSPTERAKVIKDDPNAQKADSDVKSLGLSDASQQKVYELSSKILKTLAEKSEGDSNRMNDAVLGYSHDPASMEKDLTPDQKKEINEISGRK